MKTEKLSMIIGVVGLITLMSLSVLLFQLTKEPIRASLARSQEKYLDVGVVDCAEFVPATAWESARTIVHFSNGRVIPVIGRHSFRIGKPVEIVRNRHYYAYSIKEIPEEDLPLKPLFGYKIPK